MTYSKSLGEAVVNLSVHYSKFQVNFIAGHGTSLSPSLHPSNLRDDLTDNPNNVLPIKLYLTGLNVYIIP